MITARITIEVRSPDGKRKFKRTFKGHSFVRNFLRIFGAVVMTENPVSDWQCTDYLNTARDAGLLDDDQACSALSYTTIGVGSDDTPPTTADYWLAAELGTAKVVLSTEFDSTPIYEIFWQVAIQNDSGGLWTIKEACLRVSLTWDGALRHFMIARDLVDPPIEVPNGDFVNVTYGLRSSV